MQIPLPDFSTLVVVKPQANFNVIHGSHYSSWDFLNLYLLLTYIFFFFSGLAVTYIWPILNREWLPRQSFVQWTEGDCVKSYCHTVCPCVSHSVTPVPVMTAGACLYNWQLTPGGPIHSWRSPFHMGHKMLVLNLYLMPEMSTKYTDSSVILKYSCLGLSLNQWNQNLKWSKSRSCMFFVWWFNVFFVCVLIFSVSL